MKNIIYYTINSISDISLDRFEGKKVLWILDLDDTLVVYRNKEFHPIDNKTRTWLSYIREKRKDPICFLTARTDPGESRKMEIDTFNTLNLPLPDDFDYTHNIRVKPITYLYYFEDGTKKTLIKGEEEKGIYLRKKILDLYENLEDFDFVIYVDDYWLHTDDVVKQYSIGQYQNVSLICYQVREAL